MSSRRARSTRSQCMCRRLDALHVDSRPMNLSFRARFTTRSGRTHARRRTHADARARTRHGTVSFDRFAVLFFEFARFSSSLFTSFADFLAGNRRFTAISSSRHHLGGTNPVQPRPPRRTTLTSAPPSPSGETVWLEQAFAWFSDLLVEHAEIFWSLFAVDVDTVMSMQALDTWDSFPLFQLINDYLRKDGSYSQTTPICSTLYDCLFTM